MFRHGLIHVESRYCHSKSDPPPPPPRTTRHTHNLTCDIPSHQTAYRQKTFFPRTIPEWNSLPQEVTIASSQSGTAFSKKWPQRHPRVEQPSPRSDHSTHPWLLRDQGLLPTRSLTNINEKWLSEDWSCAGRGSSPGTATVARLV